MLMMNGDGWYGSSERVGNADVHGGCSAVHGDGYAASVICVVLIGETSVRAARVSLPFDTSDMTR